MIHHLTERDPVTKTGICSVCGPVRIKKTPKSWRCLNKKLQMAKYGFSVAPPPPDTPCEICQQVRKLQLDHDHVTGKFRGWLCGPCNTMLGCAHDDIIRMQRAIEYLQKEQQC